MLEGACHCGAVRWTIDAMPESATACNCTICRRYGALWAYGHIGHDTHVSDRSTAYRRSRNGAVDFHFCPTCGCVTRYVAAAAGDDGRFSTAVNLRMTEPGPIEHLSIDHFDGLTDWRGVPRDTRIMRDMWF